MGFNCVSGQTNQLDASFGEFGFELRECAELGRANWGIIFGMREQDGPVIVNPFMEVDRACRGFRFEIGGNGTQAKSAHNVKTWPTSHAGFQAGMLTVLGALLEQNPSSSSKKNFRVFGFLGRNVIDTAIESCAQGKLENVVLSPSDEVKYILILNEQSPLFIR